MFNVTLLYCYTTLRAQSVLCTHSDAYTEKNKTGSKCASRAIKLKKLCVDKHSVLTN